MSKTFDYLLDNRVRLMLSKVKGWDQGEMGGCGAGSKLGIRGRDVKPTQSPAQASLNGAPFGAKWTQ